jgi:hypothetical protein
MTLLTEPESYYYLRCYKYSTPPEPQAYWIASVTNQIRPFRPSSIPIWGDQPSSARTRVKSVM